jgi:hypothetical protein
MNRPRTRKSAKLSERSDRFHLSDSYALGYLLLSECSNEPSSIADAVLSHWNLARVPRQHLLDVGAADGRITALLQPGFDRTEAYEPNGVLFALLAARLSTRPVTLHHDGWRVGSAPHDSVSHSFFSHVLYHVPISRWKSLIESAMRERASGRVATFVLWDEEAEAHRFCRRVNPDRWHVTSQDLAQLLGSSALLANRHWKLSTTRLTPKIRVSTRSAADAVASFLLGRRHPNTLTGRSSHNELVDTLMMSGLDNSQTIFTVSTVE